MSTPTSRIANVDNYDKVAIYRFVIEMLTWVVPALLMLAGIIAGLHMVVAGEEAFGTSDLVPWGLLIAGYVLLAVTCSGLCMVSSLGHVLGLKQLDVLGQRAVLLAITVLVSGFAVLAVELGHPLRMIYVMISPNFTSGIWWMGTIYGIYLVALIIELAAWQLGRYKLGQRMAVVTLALAIAATSNLGSVFALVNARPFWAGAYYPIYVLLTAIMSGIATLVILSWFLQRNKKGYQGDRYRSAIVLLTKALGIFVVLTGVMTFWKITASLYGGIPATQLAALTLVTGSLAVPFWLFEVGAGMVFPLVAIVFSKSRRINYSLAAAVSTLVGVVFMRYDMVIAGQKVSADALSGESAVSLAGYLPSSGEVLVLVGAIGFIISVYRISERFLKLDH